MASMREPIAPSPRSLRVDGLSVSAETRNARWESRLVCVLKVANMLPRFKMKTETQFFI